MKNSTNRDTIEAIEHALMFISLEHEHVKDITERCIKTLIGNSKNVWFDKCASLLVFDDGHMSYNVEHSNMDATVCFLYPWCNLNTILLLVHGAHLILHFIYVSLTV